MKLTKLIECATKGLANLERARDRQHELVKTEGKKLNALNTECDAHRAMLNAMLKLQDLMPPDETVEFIAP